MSAVVLPLSVENTSGEPETGVNDPSEPSTMRIVFAVVSPLPLVGGVCLLIFKLIMLGCSPLYRGYCSSITRL